MNALFSCEIILIDLKLKIITIMRQRFSLLFKIEEGAMLFFPLWVGFEHFSFERAITFRPTEIEEFSKSELSRLN